MSSDRHVTRALARGAIAAMAMTGMRTLTQGLGLIERIPPERVAKEAVPGLFTRIPFKHRDEALELAHWAYGAGGGAAFTLLPAALRRARLAGPVYGLGVWLFFELVLDPLIGLRTPHQRRVSERIALAGDHVLYGVVVASTPWPHEPDGGRG